jgi:hypothetical protein
MSDEASILSQVFGDSLIKYIDQLVESKVEKRIPVELEKLGVGVSFGGWTKSTVAAKRLGKSLATIHYWVKKGQIPADCHKIIHGRLYVHEEFLKGRVA